MSEPRRFDLLLVEDNPGDVLLAEEGLRIAESPAHLHVAVNGAEALEFLNREGRFAGAPRPDLVLLDLNLPGLNGHEVLARVKADASLRDIPVVIYTSSAGPRDVARAYENHANSYVTKPAGFDELVRTMKRLDEYWFGTVRLTARAAERGVDAT